MGSSIPKGIEGENGGSKGYEGYLLGVQGAAGRIEDEDIWRTETGIGRKGKVH